MQLDEAKESNSDLQKYMWYLKESLDDLEQCARRNNLRFHNKNMRLDTYTIMINLCKSELNIDLPDIFRSHPNQTTMGTIISYTTSKILNLNNKVYSEKRKLNHTSLFVTGDLTRYQQSIMQESKKAVRVRAGRIFEKFYGIGPNKLVLLLNGMELLHNDRRTILNQYHCMCTSGFSPR
ncbi:hypothetical protein MHBO_003085 [Bonamia ostreae]|uniref:Uncharacterized protein n=1 Tax=Bonamia ostreae TaxID=126728 RepID=A0ABV2APF9_9EUKA